MKKLFFILCFVCLCVRASAQHVFTWEIQSGLNISNVTVESYSPKVGFNSGVSLELDLSPWLKGLYTNTSALLSLKGAKIDWGNVVDGKSSAYFVDIPIHIGYKYKISDRLSIFNEFGPYVSLGVFGKTQRSTLYFDDGFEIRRISEKHDTFDELKRLDIGLGFRIGTEFCQRYTLFLRYDFGLMNGWKEEFWDSVEDDDDMPYTNLKHRNFAISMGYRF